jgi:hypothetical protein
MSRPSGPTNVFNMSGPSALLFLVVGGLMFGGCAVAITAAGDILAALVLLPVVLWGLNRIIEARDARPEPEPLPEPPTVERLVGTIYVCRIVHDDGRIQELAAESLPELQRMATRAVGTGARLELGQ